MKKFQYVAVDLAGKQVSNTLLAADRTDLIAQLQSQGLLLITSHVAEEEQAKQTAPAVPVDNSELEKKEGMSHVELSLYDQWKLFPIKKRLMVVAIGICSVFIGLSFKPRRQNKTPVPSVDSLNFKIKQLKDVMTRGELEALFPQPYPCDSPSPDKSCYQVPPDYAVEFTFFPPEGPDPELHLKPKQMRIINLKEAKK